MVFGPPGNVFRKILLMWNCQEGVLPGNSRTRAVTGIDGDSGTVDCVDVMIR